MCPLADERVLSLPRMSGETIAGYFIGLMSGTSVDAVDVGLVRVADDGAVDFIDGIALEIPARLRRAVFEVSRGATERIDDVCKLDIALAALYAECVAAILAKNKLSPGDIVAVGSHGQTVRHRPDAVPAYSLQLGNGAWLAANTGITCVNDFRARDMAYGGQGAPLAPLFHRHVFARPGRTRAAVNLGGIANITILHGSGRVAGFDTGPANTLMDQWIFKHRGERFDRGGAWAAGGALNQPLLDKLLAEPWLQRPPPKSTGPELFNLAWLEGRLEGMAIPPADTQRTLCEYSAATVAAALKQHAACEQLILCGGGAHNPLLRQRLAARLPGVRLVASGDYGIGPDWVEACMVAWLAWRALNGLPGNIPAMTGAAQETPLGAIHAV